MLDVRKVAGSPPASALAIGAVVTTAVVALPFVRFAYRAPALHVAVETAAAVVALLVAYLLHSRFRHTRRLQELLLVLALAAVAVANLVLTAVPTAVAPGAEPARWAPLGVRLVGTLLLATAALTPRGTTVGRRGATAVTLGFVGVVVAVTGAGMLGADALPPTVHPAAAPQDSTRPQLVAHPAVTGVHVLSGLLYATAAAVFVRQAARRGDALIRWFAAACVLAAFARVHYVLYPSLYSEYLYTGDLLRLGFYVCLLVGAAREVDSFWQWRVQAAVLEDRRRMARDLHDGLAQELSYIWTQSRRLSTRSDGPATTHIAAAAERALDEARRAIAALTRPLDEPVGRVLQQVAEEMAARYGVEVVVDAEPGDLPAETGDALLRIVAEAVRNAARHGGASRVDVRLTTAPLRLVVTDDGEGFEPDSPGGLRPGGFGLSSMRERATAIGAELAVVSAPGEGARLEVRGR